MKKEYFTLRNVLLCFAILVGVLMISVSAAIKLPFDTEFGEAKIHYIIWGTHTVSLGGVTTSVSEAIGVDKLPANIFGLLGVIFSFVAALALAASFFVKDAKINKIIVLSAAVIMLVGGIFQLLIVRGFVASLLTVWGSGSKVLAENIASSTRLSGGSIVCGIFTILAALGAGAIPFVPNKQLIK